MSSKRSVPHLLDIRDIVTPLWKLTYARTLKMKYEQLKKVVRGLKEEIERKNRGHYWMEKYRHGSGNVYNGNENDGNNTNTQLIENNTTSIESKSKKHKPNLDNNDLACLFHGIEPSPNISGYRNKCEFTIGRTEENRIACGYNGGRYIDGHVTVKTPELCINIPDISKYIVEKFNICLREKINDIELKSYDKEKHTGFWRLLTVRNADTSKQVMIIIQTKSTTGSDSLSIENIQDYVLNYFKSLTLPEDYKLTSVAWQLYDDVSNAAPESCTIKPLFGTTSITETLLGLPFHISPNAFFQTNSKGAEVLYSIVKKWSVSSDCILDICCGTGTIGSVLLSKEIRNVTLLDNRDKENTYNPESFTKTPIHGFEICEASVIDAVNNSKANNFNINYVLGNVYETLPSFLDSVKLKKIHNSETKSPPTILAICDPPRAGLPGKLWKTLRRCDAITDIIYVSCNAETLKSDVYKLIDQTDMDGYGLPFVCVEVIGVDMFPFTEHYETVMRLQRMTEDEYNNRNL